VQKENSGLPELKQVRRPYATFFCCGKLRILLFRLDRTTRSIFQSEYVKRQEISHLKSNMQPESLNQQVNLFCGTFLFPFLACPIAKTPLPPK
jgi:hypothetical protein